MDGALERIRVFDHPSHRLERQGFTPYDLYCTQDLTGMIADGSLASIREDARTIFKDRPLTDDCLFANSIWPEPELLGLVDDLTGRTGRNL